MSSPLKVDDGMRKYLGTRKINLQEQSNANEFSSSILMKYDHENNALLAVFIVEKSCDDIPCSLMENSIHDNSERDSKIPYLELFVTNGAFTYEGRIFAGDLKMKRIQRNRSLDSETKLTPTATAESEILEQVAKYILQQPTEHHFHVDNITVTFTILFPNLINKQESLPLLNQSKRTHIEVIVRERLIPSGVVRVIWKGSLFQSMNNHHQVKSLKERNKMISEKSNNSMDEPLYSLKFSLMLAQSLEEAYSNIVRLKTEKEKLVSQVTNWKDTSMKLENAWQRDKNELFQNFLVLLNRVKSDFRKARRDLENEKKKNDASDGVLGKKNRRKSANAQQKIRPPEVIDHPEEHDVLTFDPTEVDRLAHGKPTTDVMIEKKYKNINVSSQPKLISQSMTIGSVASQLTDNDFNPEKGTYNSNSILLSQEGDNAKEWSQTSLVRKNAFTGATEIFLDTNHFGEPVTAKNCGNSNLTEQTRKKRKFEERLKVNKEIVHSKEINDTKQFNEIKSNKEFITSSHIPAKKSSHPTEKNLESKTKCSTTNKYLNNNGDSSSFQSSSDCDSEPLL